LSCKISASWTTCSAFTVIMSDAQNSHSSCIWF